VLWFNASNASNFSSSLISLLYFNATVNDTTLSTQEVRFSFDNSNTTGFNVTGVKNAAGVWTANVTASALSDGTYRVLIIANDTVNNLNNTVANLTFLIDRVAPNMTRFWFNGSSAANMNASNYSSSLATILPFFATVSDPNFTSTVQSVQFGFYNDHNTTGFNVSAVRNTSSEWSANVTISAMSDGVYTVFLVANDTVNNVNNTIANITFRLDRTPPNVTIGTFTLGNLSNYATAGPTVVGYNFTSGQAEGNYTIRVVINDSTLTVQSVLFNVSNSSGRVTNFTGILNESNYTAFNLNLSTLAEGWYNITVVVNDTVNNVNKSVYMPFVIDRTLPSVSVSCTPASPVTGETVTCTCTASDAMTGLTDSVKFEGDIDNIQSTTASGSSGTSSVCRVNDNAGNTKTATGSWTVTAASSGGSGSSGSGGGSSSGATGDFSQETWSSINTGETATVEVANGAIGVTDVSFTVDETTYGAWVKVASVDQLPSSVSSFSGTSYKTVQITENNVAEVLQGMVTVEFKVTKTWLSDNSLTASQVALFRYADGAWGELSTTLGADDGTYVHYSAQTPGFSYFVIGEKGEAVEASAPTEEAAAGEEVAAGEEAAAEEAVAEGGAAVKKSKLWVIPLVVAIVLVVVLFYYWKKK